MVGLVFCMNKALWVVFLIFGVVAGVLLWHERAPARSAPRAVVSTDALPPLRLGWWNLEFFGNRDDPPRTAEDRQAIAEFVRRLDVQVLGVCEVDGPKPLQDLCRRLGPEWKFVVGRSGYLGEQGRIAPGILWDDTRVEMLGAGEMESLRREQLFHRLPVTAAFRCREGGPDFRVVCLHLKAGRDPEDMARRREEIAAVRAWLQGLEGSSGEDGDIVVMGDFNHDARAEEASLWSADAFVRFPSPRGNRRSIVHFNRQIDHILPLDGFDEVETRSLVVHNDQGIRDREAWRRVYSDHFPLTIDLAPEPDDDPEAKFSAQGKRLR
jgi:endonuclease/exonuclease/phosphatase family metal-dependent hydrolase